MTAYELAFLVSEDDEGEGIRTSQLETLRERLGITRRQHDLLRSLLFPAALAGSGASALIRSLPAYRGLLYLEGRRGYTAKAPEVTTFLARQRALLLASISHAQLTSASSTHSATSRMEMSLLEGWLEKRADNFWLVKPWFRRYFRLCALPIRPVLGATRSCRIAFRRAVTSVHRSHRSAGTAVLGAR